MQKKRKNQIPQPTGKILAKFEKWLQKADEIANAPRKRILAKRAAEKASPYASFNNRSFAAIIDLSLIFTIFMPILLHLSEAFYGGAINPLKGDVSHLTNAQLFEELINSQFFYGLMLDYAAHFIIFGMIFLLCWQRFSCTPGKWLLRMRIVDANSFGKPSFKQFLLRYCAYALSAAPLTLGFMWIMWNKQQRGWHDLIAGTAVIKVNHWKLSKMLSIVILFGAFCH
jgi:uncharacterized RDD family membrane protein YckC